MSDNVRVYEIAEEAGASSAEVVKKAKDLGIELKSAQSQVSFSDAEEIATYIMTGKSSKLKIKKKDKDKKTLSKKDEEAIKNKEEDSGIIKNKLEKPKNIEEQNISLKEDKDNNTSLSEISNESKSKSSTPSTPSKSPIRIIPKKRGLKIVKKLKPKIIHKPNIDINVNEENKQMKSLSEIFGSNNIKQNTSSTKEIKSKIKKDKKKPIQKDQ